ncbi:MAG: M28 family peptidase [Clostridia bacterium]|nr:M28 family peptidase [Clostridia bacterium]
MNYLDDLTRNHPIRRTVAQKQVFIKDLLRLPACRRIGIRTERTKDGKNQNIILGDPLHAKVVYTAHYDTPAAALFPNIMIPRNQVLFLLVQLLPVLLLVGIALAFSYLISAAFDFDSTVLLVSFLILYYSLYYLLYRAFTNRNNRNDNTSGVATVLALAEQLQDDRLGGVAFILFDNEEKGKKGSKAYMKDHSEEMKDRLLINFDCVGNGENILFIAMPQAEKRAEFQRLQEQFVSNEAYHVYFYPIKGSESNSDYKNFPCGIGCMACKKSKRGVFYTPRIHTRYDVVSNAENIDFIVASMLRFLREL